MLAQHLKNSWAWFKSRQVRWQQLCTHKFAGVREWVPLLDRDWVFSGTLVVELTSSDALTEEGRVMRHCVANVADDCKAGNYRVFSLRDPATDERIATLGLALEEDAWCIDDLRLEDNEDPWKELHDVAVEVLKMCAQIGRASWRATV